MKIKSLHLFTNQLENEMEFYSKILGFEVIEHTKEVFGVRVGWSKLYFHHSTEIHQYHYCFLIPCNKLEEALTWMQRKADIIDIENGRLTQRFESWNADSFYFHDASGNLAECIVRHDLKNDSLSPFNHESFLCVNEIGMPVRNIKETNHLLEENFGTSFWKGDQSRFGTNGSQEGLFLLCNHDVKQHWFPTDQKVIPEPFQASIERNGNFYDLQFDGELITKMSTS